MRRGLLTVFLVIAASDLEARAGVAPTTERVSVSSSGAEANRASRDAFISANGQVVAFNSNATNLSARKDTNRSADVFVRDLAQDTTRRVSITDHGGQANAASSAAGISRRGRVVLFTSNASNLTRRDQNHADDVFVRDRALRRTSLISVRDGHRMAGLSFADAISANARFVVFTNFPNPKTFGQRVYLRDRRLRHTVRIASGGLCPAAVVSNDGRYVAYSCDPRDSDFADARLRDVKTGHVTRFSVAIDGVGSDSTIVTGMSPDGRYTVFRWSGETNGLGRHVYEYDRVANTYTLVSAPAEFAEAGGVSEDGRYVAFFSDSSSLVAGDTNGVIDVFRHDVMTNSTVRISVAAAGGQLARHSFGGSISGDGSLVAFWTRDVFLRGPLP